MKYVAFLRGINVGGNRIIKMEELTKMFERAGFTHVKTVIASGNVVFESSETNELKLVEQIEQALHHSLGYEVKALVRSLPELQKMVSTDHFQQEGYDIKDKNTKLYITFLAQPPASLSAEYLHSDKDGFNVIKMIDREVYIVTRLLPNGRFGVLTSLEKVLGKYTTTRNWNTIIKIATTY